MSADAAPVSSANPRAIIFGCAGDRLSRDERRFFAETRPLGFVLFGRNCKAPDQVRALIAEFRDAVGRSDAPVLIDQEGGRVARLRPPHWRNYPAPARIAALPDPQAVEAVELGARLIADDLAALGITVDAAPVLDLPMPGADRVIGDRAFGAEPARVARLGRAVCDGLLAGGVLPIVKHIPGHGRATVDSHTALPRVEASAAELAAHDFGPFRALAEMPWAMTAHIVFAALDGDAPATMSSRVISEAIRCDIGFGGVLVSDDISMGALRGSLGERTGRSLDAGCDLVLHCTGALAEMQEVAAAAGPISATTAERLARGETLRRESKRAAGRFERAAAEARFDALLAAMPSA